LIALLNVILGCQEVTVKKVKIILSAKIKSRTSGEISFTEKGGLVTMEAHIYGLDTGTHAIHLH
jgi:Cu-Zn family superoxide dismutase